MKDCYIVTKDPEVNGLLVIFGTEQEANSGTISGDFDSHEAFTALQQVLNDSTSMCEDYLIESELYTKESDISKVESIVGRYGFTKNPKLLTCEWS